jgi:hypothetical protein
MTGISLPLCAVFYLEQSTSDRISEAGEGLISLLLARSTSYEACTIHREEDDAERAERNKKIFDNACAIAHVVPGFVLGASLEGRFWELIDEALRTSVQNG